MAKQRNDAFAELEERYDGYEVRDRDGDKIGKVDDLFVDENDSPEYIGVKMGFLGTRSTLIPMDIATVREDQNVIEVAAEKGKVKDGPSFDDDEDITPEYEARVRDYYGLEGSRGAESRGAYGAFSRQDYAGGERPGAATSGVGHARGGYSEEEQRDRKRSGEVRPGTRMGDTETGEFRGHGREQEGLRQPGSELEDVDERRVQRTEEELRVGTREREAGGVNVRKRVRTEREQVRVPKRREEVHVERAPVEGREVPEADIGEDEVYVPVTEEEVVVEKRPVVKEEIRVRKDVSHDEEVVEEDVRKEEIEIDDRTERRGTPGRGTNPDDASRRRGR